MNIRQALSPSQTLRLTQSLEATLIHGKTGQEVSDDTLPIGTLIAAWNVEQAEAGKSNLFLASTDVGESWYRYQSYGDPQTEPINPRYVATEDEDGTPRDTVVSRGPKPPAAALQRIG